MASAPAEVENPGFSQGNTARQRQIEQMLGDLREDPPDPEALEIVPHPRAPLFSGEDSQENLSRAIETFSTGGEVTDDETRQLLAQAGLVNLWVFAKYIAGFSGPFNLLNNHLHVSMCNYRQRLLVPGSRGAMFIPRSHYKSTIVTEAASAWEIIRDPNIRIRITNATEAKAVDFMHSVKGIFDDNPLVQWLYPEFYVPTPSTQARWNETEIVCPARGRKYREATVSAGGVGGASEGHHFDLHIVDDLIGLKALNTMQTSAAEMIRARNWFWGSEKSLLVSMRYSRVIVVGTRYAEDDVYSDILERAVECWPVVPPDWSPNLQGQWTVYYRSVAEKGQIIFPESVTKKGLLEMAENDWWTLVTQYFNWPQASGLAELSDNPPLKCQMVLEHGDWVVSRWYGGEEVKIPLVAMDVIQAEDPAATERYIDAKHSRTAWGVIAEDEDENVYLVDLRADFVPASVAIEWLFLGKQKWPVRGTYLEMQGPFKILGPMVRGEESRRGRWLNMRPVKLPGGDKDARIRTALQPLLDAGRLFVAEPFWEAVWEELRGFPQSRKKDILDMLATGVRCLNRPLTAREEREKEQTGKMWSRRAAMNSAGY